MSFFLPLRKKLQLPVTRPVSAAIPWLQLKLMLTMPFLRVPLFCDFHSVACVERS